MPSLRASLALLLLALAARAADAGFVATRYVDAEAAAASGAHPADLASRALGLGPLHRGGGDKADAAVRATAFDRPLASLAVVGGAARASPEHGELAARLLAAHAGAAGRPMAVSLGRADEGAEPAARDAAVWGEAGVTRADVGDAALADELEWAAAAAARLAADPRASDAAPDAVELRVAGLERAREGADGGKAAGKAAAAVLARLAAPYGGRALARVSMLEAAAEPGAEAPEAGAVPASLRNGDVGRYQITLWLVVILVAFLLWGMLMMCCMDVGEDSLLYGSFNPNWDKKNR